MSNNLIYRNIIRKLHGCKKSSSVYEFKELKPIEYQKKVFIINNVKKELSIPTHISKELDNILKKYYNDYNK